MPFETWILLIGGLLLLMGLGGAYFTRLPFTATMVYLALGLLLGPGGWAVLHVDPRWDTSLFHRAAEVAVVISLFTVGLKLRIPLRDPRWVPSVVLAFGSMTLTVGLLTLAAVWGLGLPLGAAVLLGAILAPTDPVLASEVQLEHAADRDELRLALSGEAGLNDGTAFPFVLLGLGLLGLHELGDRAWRWWTFDVGWAVIGGLTIGAILGYAVGRLILHLRSGKREAATLDEYLLLGLIGSAYGVAIIADTYGFLAVFAAGVAVRAVEMRHGSVEPEDVGALLQSGLSQPQLRHDPRLAPAYMAGALLSFNEQLERILEVGLVLLVGAALVTVGLKWDALWFVALLLFVIRPLAVWPVWWTRRFTRTQFAGVAWFGVRGIGSVYYLMYAITRGLPGDLADEMASLTLTVVAASIVLHGISVTPLIRYVERERERLAAGWRSPSGRRSPR